MNIPEVSFDYYAPVEEYESEKENLETQFENSPTIPGTRRLHCFVPQSPDTVLMKCYSTSSHSEIQRVSKSSTELEIEEVLNIICSCGRQWWVAHGLEKDSKNSEVKLSLLSPNGSSRPSHTLCSYGRHSYTSRAPHYNSLLLFTNSR